ncbi:nitrate- and nitrite sensing domain-containing protein [bacterium]|nr:nitrate- and nitrite sensing domain-containing protein [bacterium]
MNIFKKLFARPKLSVISILIVLAVSAYIALTYILSLLNDLNDTNIVKNQVFEINNISSLVTELIHERSLNSLYFDNRSQEIKNKLNEQREKTNLTIKKLSVKQKPLKFASRLKNTRKVIDGIDSSTSLNTIQLVEGQYVLIINDLMENMVLINQLIKNRRIKNEVYAHLYIIKTKELMGQIQILIKTTLKQKRFTNISLRQFMNLTSIYKESLDRYMRLCGPDLKSYTISMFQNKTVVYVQNTFNSMARKLYSGNFDVPTDKWWNNANNMIVILDKIEKHSMRMIKNSITTYKKIIYQKFVKVLFFVLFILTMIIISTAPKDVPVHDKSSQLSKIYKSPVYLLLLVSVTIIVAQTISLVLFYKNIIPSSSPFVAGVTGALFSMLMILPVLYFFLFCPLIVHIRERRQIEVEKEKLLKELFLKNKKLEKLNQLKSDYVSDVSHEFKNPLTVIRETISFILKLDSDTGLNTRQKKMLELGKNSTERLIRLINDLLDLSKIESGRIELKKEMINITALLKEIIMSNYPLIKKNGLKLKKEFSKNIEFVKADKDKIIQVFINLLSNAIKYINKGDTITVALSQTVNKVIVEFKDTGPGIPADKINKIFDKFERITQQNQDGTGLGLPIAKEIIELHGGNIRLESEVGKGSNFIVEIPK